MHGCSILKVLKTISLFVSAATALALSKAESFPFSISEVDAGEGFLLSGPASVHQTWRRYGITPLPVDLVARAAVNATVKASPTEYDSTYLIPVVIGSPPSAQTYTASLDTGSAMVSFYIPSVKTSSESTTVNIGGVMVAKQLVQINSDASGGSNAVGFTEIGSSFYADAVAQGSMAPVFTAALNRGAPGVYTLGLINPSSYSGVITYVSASTSKGFWEITGSGYAVGTSAFAALTFDAIVDTGTTLLYLPQQIVKAYYAQVKGAALNNADGGFVFPCTATLPDLTVGIGSYRALVPGNYLNYAPLESGSSTCFGGLQSDSGIGFSIFGLTFIKSQFVVFKGTSSPSVGFAKKA